MMMKARRFSILLLFFWKTGKTAHMNIERIQKSLGWAIIATETSHIFCCILPTLFSLLSFAVGIGMIAAMPASLDTLHDVLHDWEMPLIVFSGAVISFGWLIHYIARRIDCHDTGCHHGSCTPRKRKAGRILKFATLLFLFNVLIYTAVHRGMDPALPAGPAVIHNADDGHRH